VEKRGGGGRRTVVEGLGLAVTLALGCGVVGDLPPHLPPRARRGPCQSRRSPSSSRSHIPSPYSSVRVLLKLRHRDLVSAATMPHPLPTSRHPDLGSFLAETHPDLFLAAQMFSSRETNWDRSIFLPSRLLIWFLF
jgi:hypothetical protein